MFMLFGVVLVPIRQCAIRGFFFPILQLAAYVLLMCCSFKYFYVNVLQGYDTIFVYNYLLRCKCYVEHVNLLRFKLKS